MSDEIITLQRDLHLAKEKLARVEAQLAEAELERSESSALAEAISSLRQELRTPLNTVLGFAQLLKSSAFGDCDAVEQIFTAASRLAELIEESSTKTPGANGHRPPEAQPLPKEAPRDRSRTVLCIEDNAANCRLIEDILEKRSHITLFFAADGSEGLALARDKSPDLILLDLNLPDMHGSEVLQRLREDSRTENLPVVVISADATATQIERLLSNGARNYLTKPIDVARFLYTVDEILDAPRA